MTVISLYRLVIGSIDTQVLLRVGQRLVILTLILCLGDFLVLIIIVIFLPGQGFLLLTGMNQTSSNIGWYSSVSLGIGHQLLL